MLETDPETKKKTIKDYPKVYNYVNEKYKIDISDVPIYYFQSSLIEKNKKSCGLNNAAGFFVKFLNSIYIKSRIEKHKKTKSKSKSKTFNGQLETLSVSVEEEDVVVHECLHAVSAKLKRKMNQYKNSEEAFVYTGSVDFYKEKGYTEEYIIDNIFLPFCVSDILQFRFKMVIDKLIKESSKFIMVRDFYSPNRGEKKMALDKHSSEIIPIIKKEAIEMGKQMILLHDKYKFNGTIQPEKEEVKEKRFSQIDFSEELF